MQQLLNVRFKQLQLEQDSGKITYGEPTSSNGGKETLIDYNRAGTRKSVWCTNRAGTRKSV